MNKRFASQTVGVFCVLVLAACSAAPSPQEGSGDPNPAEAVGAAVAATTTVAQIAPTANDLKNYVHAPGGVFTHKSCTHEIPNWGSIDDNFVVKDSSGNTVAQYEPCKYKPVITRPNAPTSVSGTTTTPNADTPPSTDGWISATFQFIPSGATTWNGINANVKVPGAPEDTGALEYYFNGLETSSFNPILQPVLQWGDSPAPGGTYWSFASYRVYSDGTTAYTSPITVDTGDTLLMQVYLYSISGSNYTYAIIAEDTTRGTNSSGLIVQNTAAGGIDFPYFFPAVHESYGDTDCEDAVEFYNINQFADVDVTPATTRVDVANSPQQWTCRNGDHPSCFDCPDISPHGTYTYVY